MLKKFAPMALAAAVAVTLAGCPGNTDRADVGGGGGTETERNTNVAENRDMNNTATRDNENHLALNWGSNLDGEKRDIAEGFTRAAWVQSNLAAGEWDQAREDLDQVQEHIQDLSNHEDIPMVVRNQITEIRPLVTQLSEQINSRDRNALTTSNQLVDRFSTFMNDRNTIAWMSERNGNQGGGAGTGTMDDRNQRGTMDDRSQPGTGAMNDERDPLHNDNRDRNVNP